MRFKAPRGVYGILIAAVSAIGQDAAFTEPTGTITLEQAVYAALQGSPRLAAFDWELRAADWGGILQAGSRPNPELSLEIEKCAAEIRAGRGCAHALLKNAPWAGRP